MSVCCVFDKLSLNGLLVYFIEVSGFVFVLLLYLDIVIKLV